MRIVLASTSPYRRLLLERLSLPFTVEAPGVDEAPTPGESARSLALRLAQEKARAVALRAPRALVIGCDQAVECDGRIFGKPNDPEGAHATLRALSGRIVRFLTGICVLNTRTNACHAAVEPFDVTFRPLTDAQIRRYVEVDRPFDCAGAFRSEGLGIALVERMRGEDPHALVGLPLIRLVDFLAREGVSPLGA
jgi:MAF protein